VKVITREGIIIRDELWYIRTGLHTIECRFRQEYIQGVVWEKISQQGMEQRSRITYNDWCGRTYINQECNRIAEVYTWRGVGEYVLTRNGTEE
jgi:hypothetical protein